LVDSSERGVAMALQCDIGLCAFANNMGMESATAPSVPSIVVCSQCSNSVHEYRAVAYPEVAGL